MDGSAQLEAPDAEKHARSVSVVVPTLNEEGSIAWVLENIPEWVSEVVLVDGLSTDHTEAIARRARPDIVVVHQYQRGKGAALRAGFAAATGDVVVMLDADGSTDPAEMNRFVEALEHGADFVKGSRHMESGGSADFTRLRATGNLTFVKLANILYGSRFTDLCYGYCAFWRRHLGALMLTADGFEIETQLVLNAVKAGLQIHEVPSFELERRAGSSNLNPFRDGRRVLSTMLRERSRRQAPRKSWGVRIDLREDVVPSMESATWRPAGHERRRSARRVLDPAGSEYPGPERRGDDRRTAYEDIALVYRVVAEEAAA
jgi:glycosyltransferase involved in cell wall biosynthesis